MNALAIDPTTPTTLYAGIGLGEGTGEGVYKSVDGGASWTPHNAGLTSMNVLSLVIDPTVPGKFYAGTRHLIYGGSVLEPNLSGDLFIYTPPTPRPTVTPTVTPTETPVTTATPTEIPIIPTEIPTPEIPGSAVPEPTTALLFGAGLLALIVIGFQRKFRK